MRLALRLGMVAVQQKHETLEDGHMTFRSRASSPLYRPGACGYRAADPAASSFGGRAHCTQSRPFWCAVLLVALYGAPGQLAAQAPDSSASPPRQLTAGRVLLFGGLGLVGGAALGMAYGEAGHPGLPHKCCDVPPFAEYLVEFAVVGAVAGGVIAVVTAPRQRRFAVTPRLVHVERDAANRRTRLAWGAQVNLRF